MRGHTSGLSSAARHRHDRQSGEPYQSIYHLSYSYHTHTVTVVALCMRAQFVNQIERGSVRRTGRVEGLAGLASTTQWSAPVHTFMFMFKIDPLSWIGRIGHQWR